jgi:hypothetical protein
MLSYLLLQYHKSPPFNDNEPSQHTAFGSMYQVKGHKNGGYILLRNIGVNSKTRQMIGKMSRTQIVHILFIYKM